MIAAKLLAVRVQPVFVLVDLDTLDVRPAPVVDANEIPAAALGQLAELIDQARKQIEANVATPATADGA